jgi:hypothetical protein
MFKKVFSDPLLGIAWVLLTFFLVLFALAGVASLVAFVAIPFIPHQIADVMEAGATVTAGQASAAFAGLCLLLIGLFAAIGYFTLLLRRIVGSVADGDPFIADNARRLRNMGWLCVLLTFAAPLFVIVVNWLDTILGDTEVTTNVEFSGDGLLLALILFILARVFRHGTAMREDLEGTV